MVQGKVQSILGPAAIASATDFDSEIRKIRAVVSRVTGSRSYHRIRNLAFYEFTQTPRLGCRAVSVTLFFVFLLTYQKTRIYN